MASYLEEYGESQARRSRTRRWLILTPLAVVVVGTVLYFAFRDFPEQRKAKQFVELLQRKDYKAAYTLWGCTETQPCPQYAFDKFLEDWGPDGSFKNLDQARVTDFHGCKAGVIGTVQAPGQEDTPLWVDRRTGEIGFAPWKLREVPPGWRTQLAGLMWNITRNCDPLIAP